METGFKEMGSMKAIDEDQDLKWLAEIWVGDLMGIYSVMGGTMV